MSEYKSILFGSRKKEMQNTIDKLTRENEYLQNKILSLENENMQLNRKNMRLSLKKISLKSHIACLKAELATENKINCR